MTMRTEEMEAKYQEARTIGDLVPLGDEPRIIDAPNFVLWKIVHNRFPHDRHHDQHVLIVLKRDCPLGEVTPEELAELWGEILPWADTHFDYLKLNLSSLRSVNHTPHLHLLVLKPEYK